MAIIAQRVSSNNTGTSLKLDMYCILSHDLVILFYQDRFFMSFSSTLVTVYHSYLVNLLSHDYVT